MQKAIETLLAWYATIFFLLCLGFYFMTWRGFWTSLLDSVRFIGLLSLVGSPLFALYVDNYKAGIAMGSSGLIALLAVTIIFKKDLQRPTLRPATVAREDSVA